MEYVHYQATIDIVLPAVFGFAEDIYGVAVVSMDALFSHHLVVHEFGHLMGGLHQEEVF